MDQTQGSQRFDQVELASIQIAEVFIAVENVGELPGHIVAVARQQHPQVVNRGSPPAVVEIDEMGAGRGSVPESLREPQNVADVAVSVQAQRAHRAGPLEAAAHTRECELDHRSIRVDQVRRNEIVREKPVARLLAEAGNIEGGPLDKRRSRADGVNASDEATEPLSGRPILELGCTAAAIRIDSEAITPECEERPVAAELQWRDDGYFALGELVYEGVLLEDLRVGPTVRPVKLGHVRRLAFHRHLVDAVFVAVERKQAAVAGHADAVERVEHDVGRQSGVRGRVLHGSIL